MPDIVIDPRELLRHLQSNKTIITQSCECGSKGTMERVCLTQSSRLEKLSHK